jgi:hypothetical protein
MKVNELIEYLNQLVEDNPAAGEFKVVMSADGEGSRYSEMSGAIVGHVDGDCAWNLEYQGDAEDWEIECGSDEPYPGDNCVSVWPT